MEKKKDLLYEKFKDRCSDNGMTGEESGDIEMCWIIARDILTQERKQELDRAREEGFKKGMENAWGMINDILDTLDVDKNEEEINILIGILKVLDTEIIKLSKLTIK